VGDRISRGGESEACRNDLVSLHNQITGTVFGSSVQAGAIHGDVNIHSSAQEQIRVPAQLLPCPPHFTGREPELSRLTRFTDHAQNGSRPLLIVVSGAGGIGKTSLGLCWLHQIRNNYPDGQLFMDLRGLAEAAPMPPSEPLERFLRALGLAPEKIPQTLRSRRPFIAR
jgi:hypothetical protein